MMKQKEVKDSTQKRNIDQQEETRLRPKKDTLMKQKTKRPTRRDVAADRRALLPKRRRQKQGTGVMHFFNPC
jgi:hypothetical protein